MRFVEYLPSKFVTLCFLGIGGLFFGSAFVFVGVETQVVLIFSLMYLLFIVLWLSVSYYLDLRKVKKLEKLISQMPDKYLLGEVLPPPTDVLERQYYRIMKEMSRSAVGVAEGAIREKDEYCDYVESWIHGDKNAAYSLLADFGKRWRWKKTENRAEAGGQSDGEYFILRQNAFSGKGYPDKKGQGFRSY